MNVENCYNILGNESRSASKPELKKIYRKLALEHHPDKGGDEEKFKEITEAYETLTGKRQSQRSPPPQPNFDAEFMRGFGFGNPFQKQKQQPPETDAEVFIQMNISVEDIRKGKPGTIEYKKSKQCKDCNGIGGKSKQTCHVCNGTGRVMETQSATENSFIGYARTCHRCKATGEIIEEPCATCNADGYVTYLEKVSFEIKEKDGK